MTNPVRALRKDERGFIVSWLVKLAIGFALTALILYEAGAIGVNFFTLDSTADDIAVKMSVDVRPGVVPRQADLDARASALAKESGAKLVSVQLVEGSIVVQIRRRAKTLVVHRFGLTKDWARSTAEGRAGTT